MAVTPRRSLDDYAVENLACSICGQPTLHVKKVGNLPDFVSCSTCQAAFLVEEGGPRVLYGQIPDSYPDTKAYALKKWLLREAIDLQALKERPAAKPPGGMASSAPYQQPAAQSSQPAQPGQGTGQEAPSAGDGDIGQETPARGVEPIQPSSPSVEYQTPGSPPRAPDRTPAEDVTPQGLELNIDLPDADQFPAPDPSPPGIEEPAWLRPPGEEQAAAPEAPDAETVHLPEDPFAERFATQDEIESIEDSASPEVHDVKHGIEWPSTSEEDELDQSNLPDWLRPDSSTTSKDQTPDLSDMPGVPIPTEPLSEPAGSGIALESQPRLKPRHYDTLPPQPGTPAAAGARKPSDLPPVPTPSSKEDISRPVEDEGPGFELTSNDPAPGERFRVVIKGVKVQLPTEFCAHCGRAPVKGRVVVTGSLPSSKILGQRQATQFNVPLCEECYQRSQHPKEEVQSARLQASLVSTLTAVVVLVLGLVFGLVNLQSTSIPNLMILLVLAAIGYAIPAVILFGRIQDMPVTPEMHYIQTTLIVPGEAQGLETAFEWRNPLYAQRFAELNQQNVVGSVSQIKQRPMT